MSTGFIETEHLLLGPMRVDVLLGIKLINQRVSAEGLREELARGIQTRDVQIPTSADLPLSDEAKRVLSRAAEEAQLLQEASIDSGHLVLGVFGMKGKAAAALEHQGIDYEAYREAMAAAPESRGPRPVEESRTPPEPSVEPAPGIQVAAPSLREIVSKLDQLVEQASGQLGSPSENFGYHRLKRKSWTRKEALGHLIDWATTHHRWFARALTEPRLTAGAYPDDSWVSAQRYTEVPWMTLLALWTSLNRLLIHILAGVPEEKLDTSCRIGIEPPRTFRDLIAAYVEHCDDIIGQMLALG